MRAFIMSAVVGLVVFAWSGMARAQVVERAANAVAGAAVNGGVNANMQFHNGRWWYWQPNSNHWMVYHDNQWYAPNSTGGYAYSDGRPLWSNNPAPRYSTGYRGNYYGSNNSGYYGNGYNNGYYGNGYNNGYYGNQYGNGYGNSYGRGNYGYGNRGANVGANIGGAIGGGRGAGIGAAIGGALNN